MEKVRLYLFAAALFWSSTVSVNAKHVYPIYKDSLQCITSRVNDLMARMSLEEKVGQMCQYISPWHINLMQPRSKQMEALRKKEAVSAYRDLSVEDLLKMTEEGKIGSFLHVLSGEQANKLQNLALKSRLQIPLLFGTDAIHGNAISYGATVYPTPIGQASSFDIDLVEELSRQSALEIRATGSNWTFAPNVDVARDARWGRVGETFGEDPYLVSCMGMAVVRGLQGKNNKFGCDKVAACGKHYIAGSEPVNGINQAPMDVSERTLREVYLPPYQALVKAGVFSLMAAHNDLNGIPCHINKHMMNDIMRTEYGFKGFIVSDWKDMEKIYDGHHVAESLEEAFGLCVDAGVDMHMHGPCFLESILRLVKEGKLLESQINRGCRAILEAKFRLGLFEHPFVEVNKAKELLFDKKHRETALSAAERSIVLLKNENLLPLDFSKFKKILVTGPNADSDAILGDWAVEQPDENVITILEGLRAVAGKNKIVYCDYGADVQKHVPSKVKEAVSLARCSDLAIVVVGENSLKYRPYHTCGENVDRINLDLLGSQEELVEEIHKTGIPTIVVLVGGRPLSVNWIAEHVEALIQAWEPGSLGGTAVANILSGKVNPSAKLPITVPRYSGQIQMIYNHKSTQYLLNYIDGPTSPLYPFGYGLSYTTFDIGTPTVSAAEIGTDENLDVSVRVTNTGSVEGTEVVQLYISDLYSSATRPLKELKDFVRVSLRPGESKVIHFTITPDKLAFYNKEMIYGVEKGDFEVKVGSSSADIDLKKAKFRVR